MLRNLLLIFLVTGLSFSAFAQTLRGVVTDAASGETLIGANIVVKNGETIVKGAATDIDGRYQINGIDAGTYNVEISYVGYSPIKKAGVIITPTGITNVNAALQEGGLMDEVELVSHVDPIIKDEQITTISAEKIKEAPIRNLNALASSGSSGIDQTDRNGGLNVKGGRGGEVVYFVDGVKQRGSSLNLPQQALDQMNVIIGGVPAEYGDGASGIISVVTRGPSSVTAGGIDFETSQFLDPYGYNRLGGYFTTPLIWKDKDAKIPLIGVFASAQLLYQGDYSQSRYIYKIKDEVLDNARKNPLIITGNPNAPIVNPTLSYIRSSDIEKLDHLEGATSLGLTSQTKFDVKLGEYSRLKVGGTFTLNNTDQMSRALIFANPDYEYKTKSSNLSAYATFQQFFQNESEDGEKATIQDAMYTLHADYSLNNLTQESPKHEDNLFRYGYAGKFTPKQRDAFLPFNYRNNEYTVFNKITGEEETVRIQSTSDEPFPDNSTFSHVIRFAGATPESFSFTPSSINENHANLASQYFGFANPLTTGSINSLPQGVRNGTSPASLLSLWSNVGINPGSRFKQKVSQFRFTGSTSGSIGNHNLKMGFEFEQRSYKTYNVGASNLWNVARLVENSHLSGANYKYEFNGEYNQQNQAILDAIPLYEESQIVGYAKNVRDRFGLSYDKPVYTDAMNPDDLSIDLFSQEQIYDQGLASGLGYDLYGNEITGSQPTFNDFLTDSLADGTLTRKTSAFEPIYIAGYIQDKLTFNDMILSVGIRVDRYDANQPVLKDKYTIYDARTASEVNFDKFGATRPSAIGDDFVVYVDDEDNPKSITAYRDGDNWYDAQGNRVTDLQKIAGASGSPIPYLTEDAKEGGLVKNSFVTDKAFTDYEPEVVVMPRIAFNFPISDEAKFFANYDLLTQRPGTGNGIFNPGQILDIARRSTSVRSSANPDLKMQKNTNYEVGFKQKLTDISAISLSAFYREQRDMIQITQVTNAYPISYTLFDNRDFGTTKGFTLEFEKRVGENDNLSLTANYTLQFADGTGSNSATAAGLIRAGIPNLRQTLPLSFDTRHTLKAQIRYGFPSGDAYNGPAKLKNVLQGMSIFLLGNVASGRPYTLGGIPYASQETGAATSPSIKGTVNGSRLPFRYNIDLSLSKRFTIAREGKKDIGMRVYAGVQNLLNTENILSVFRATGNSNDDGWLSSPQGQDKINALGDQGNTYVDFYNTRLDNPYRYSSPRTIRVGVSFEF
ncbi:MAG: carboxypeptidase regulatory-like domain-containing protein [Flavobacteriales bacterium]|jgi:outer membrane receptor protein involved in Fe transport|nr:carboxypeptidase regulatory-like domain-containing protein [Flavobacteriales bacterium]